MSPGEIAGIAGAGAAAGAINTVVGSGTLITFPVLLGFGFAPVTANVSNSVGLVPGSVSGAIGYRRELAGQRERALRLGTASVLGGATGAALLLSLPAAAFKAVVPVFIGLAVVVTLLQPRLTAWLAHREIDLEQRAERAIVGAVFLSGIYGGYFGAAQGVLLLALLGTTLKQDLQRTNALKNVLAALVNGVAGICFVIFAHVSWEAAGLLAGGAILGAQVGARYGRRLPASGLRALIVAVGVFGIVRLLA